MKNVRVWFTKDGAARYISHLDLNRCMTRAVCRSKLPIWYTEGFNPHPFMTFSLPLSLGFRGRRESMDIRLLQDVSNEEAIEKLNACLPKGIRVFDVTEPQMKPGRISYALFTIKLFSEECGAQQIADALSRLLSQDEIMVEKKSKSGIKEVDLKEQICRYESRVEEDVVWFEVLLPAGSTANVNPGLIIEALRRVMGKGLCADITREELYNEEVEPFC